MRVLLLFLIMPTIMYSQNQVISSVKGHVPILKQPKKMDCWITVTTMLLSWKDDYEYTLHEVVEKIGEPWSDYFEKNKGLSRTMQNEFIKKIGMIGEPPANYMLDAYIDFIDRFGPLWITTTTENDRISTHAKILISIEGDRSYKNSTLVFIDPEVGNIVRQNALDFVLEFEEEARIYNINGWGDLMIQIYHF